MADALLGKQTPLALPTHVSQESSLRLDVTVSPSAVSPAQLLADVQPASTRTVSPSHPSQSQL